MDTTNYFYAAYTVFWLFPTIFVIRLFSQIKSMEKKLSELQNRVS